MSSEETVDPRSHGMRPTQEEIDAWAAREHRRREAWLAGPGEEERRDWARRYRWRAALGLEESRLGPLPEEVEEWAAREHKRRQEWMAGPSEAEKREWARRYQAQGGGTPASAAAPPDEALEGWTARERRRRQQWLAGPSEEEKEQWAERQARGTFEDLLRFPGIVESGLPDTLQSLLREAELAGKGALYSLTRAPRALWEYFTQAGKAFEEEFYQKPPRRRIRY
jgi:hypothetical protein